MAGAPNPRPLGRAARHGLRTSDAAGAGPLGRPRRGAAFDPARHAGHDPRRRHRPRGLRDRDAGLQRARAQRPALPPGVRDGAGDAALARLDDDGAVSGRPRRPPERALPGRDPSRPRREAARGRAIARRRSCRPSSWPAASGWRADSTSTTTRCRRGARSGAPWRRPSGRWPSIGAAGGPAAFPLGPLLRPPRALPPPEPFRSRFAARPYLGEIAAMDEQLGRLVQAFEQRRRRPGRDRDRRRPRRGARRPRRVAARQPPLPIDDARPAAADRARRRARRRGDAGEHAAGLPHRPRLGGARRGEQPSRATPRRSSSGRP